MASDQEKLNFYLPADEADWIRKTCEAEQRTISGYMRLLIRRDRAARTPQEPNEEAA